MQDKIKGWIKLLSTKGIGRTTAIKLAKKLGEPYKFLYEDTYNLQYLDNPNFNISYLTDKKDPPNWGKISKSIKNLNLKFVSILDDEYPELLKQIFDPPPFLFYLGNLNKELFQRIIAVVGTRKPSSYGKLMCSRITKLLVENKFTIVSGLAFGIDTIAHKTAIENNYYTIAVLGTSLDNIYPYGNIKLAEKIIEKGLLLSEQIPTIKTEKWTFPERNRIISGLSLGTVVIEGSKKSGSLITARFALDQNRDVFALPGDINRIQAEGPNYLIKLGAKIISKPSDILEEYNIGELESYIQISNLSDKENYIYQLIKNHDTEISFDKILFISGYQYSELTSIIISLELKNIIRKTLGNRYIAII